MNENKKNIPAIILVTLLIGAMVTNKHYKEKELKKTTFDLEEHTVLDTDYIKLPTVSKHVVFIDKNENGIFEADKDVVVENVLDNIYAKKLTFYVQKGCKVVYIEKKYKEDFEQKILASKNSKGISVIAYPNDFYFNFRKNKSYKDAKAEFFKLNEKQH